MHRRIEGIITPLGAGAVGNSKTWNLTFRLNPWREVGGDIVCKDVRVLFPMSEASASRGMSRWDKGAAVRFAVSTVKKPSGKHPWWLAQASAPIASIRPDAELLAAASQQAGVVQDPVLGRLKLDSALDWYQGERKTRGHSYQVAVEVRDPDDEKKVAAAISRSATAIVKVEREIAKIRRAIADELLQTYNDSWREGGRPLSQSGFVKRLILESVVASPDRTTAYFSDSGLFAGHVVEVRILSRGRISEICLAG
jgi:hypothetical protein